jgi:hypothetical protein
MIDLSKIVLKDSNGNPSVTVTAFVVGFVVASTKLLFSGMTIGELTLSQFSGVDFAAAVGALGAIYSLRRNKTDDLDSNKE